MKTMSRITFERRDGEVFAFREDLDPSCYGVGADEEEAGESLRVAREAVVAHYREKGEDPPASYLSAAEEADSGAASTGGIRVKWFFNEASIRGAPQAVPSA